MFSFLNKPYPHSTNLKRNVLVSFCIGAFVALFLIVFQPFDITSWADPDKKIKLAGFGLISFIIPLFFNLLFLALPLKEREDNWKVWKELLNIIFSVLLIAAGNLFYSTLIGIAQISPEAYFRFISLTFAIGIFPISFSVASKYNKFLKLNQKEASAINALIETKEHNAEPKQETPVQKKITLLAENGKDKLELEPGELLYVESADNYSMVFFMKDTSSDKVIIRSSLKRIEQQVEGFQNITRCHRAFIVNLQNVTHIEGNAAGYKLSLKNTGISVPVSRNYGAAIIQKLRSA